eukprot:1099566-Prorocentrum_minimum.AAC.1
MGPPVPITARVHTTPQISVSVSASVYQCISVSVPYICTVPYCNVQYSNCDSKRGAHCRRTVFWGDQNGVVRVIKEVESDERGGETIHGVFFTFCDVVGRCRTVGVYLGGALASLAGVALDQSLGWRGTSYV